MVETEKETLVDYSLVKMDLLKKVNEIGPLGEMENWKTAFPEVDFWNEDYYENEDEDYCETPIKWEDRTVSERLFYVVFSSCKEMELRYSIVVEDTLKVNQVIKDRENIWWMWKDGCFSGEDLTEDAIRDFVEYSIASGEKLKREHVDDMDLDQIRIEEIEAKVRM